MANRVLTRHLWKCLIDESGCAQPVNFLIDISRHTQEPYDIMLLTNTLGWNEAVSWMLIMSQKEEAGDLAGQYVQISIISGWEFINWVSMESHCLHWNRKRSLYFQHPRCNMDKSLLMRISRHTGYQYRSLTDFVPPFTGSVDKIW